MTLAQYWTLVVKRYKIIVSCFLIVGLVALFASKLMTPQYQSAVLVQIAISSGANQSAYNSLLASDQLVQTEAILATSDTILRSVASQYRGLSVDQLAKEVTATPKLNTQIFEIDVIDPSPIRAAGLANSIAVTLIQQQNQVMQQQSSQTGDSLLVAQNAQPASSPVRPNVSLNTGAGLLVGLLLGILLVILLEQLDTRVRTSEVVTQLSGYSTLATIWKADSDTEIINPKRSDPNVEPYRILRTNIGFSIIDKPLRSLVVTSSTPREGKSTVAANLAIFMARAGKKTLLIDADLRRPSVHEIFDLPASSMGLSNAILAFSVPGVVDTAQSGSSNTDKPLSKTSLSANISLDAFLHKANIPNLLIMPSGPLPPNPSELLDSQAMQHCFAALTSYGADIVIFDSVPLLGLSDSSILASKADGTLVVVDITQAMKKDVKQSRSLLEQAGAHVLGCVLNKQRRSRKDKIFAYYSADIQDSGKNYKVKADILSLPNTPVETLTQEEAKLDKPYTRDMDLATTERMTTVSQLGDRSKSEQHNSEK